MVENQDLAQLLVATSRQDRKAFESLYQQSSSNLFPLALRILKSEMLAQECLQEAYLKIWNNAHRYQASKAKPMTWMGTIIRNTALDMLRWHQIRPEDREAYETLEFADELAETELLHEAEHSKLYRCLEGLQEEYRRPLLLAFVEGYTHAELADKLETPLGTIKTWIRRALGLVKECLEH